MSRTLEITTSPHVTQGASVDRIMRDVVIALVPVVAFAIYHFGLAALATLAAATLSCLAAERLLSKPGALSDWSAVVTGLLLGLSLPPGLPLWMSALGGVVAIAIGKTLFGGLGCNAFNPALVGRTFLAAAFPAAMTTWLAPGSADRFTGLPSSSLAWPFPWPLRCGSDAGEQRAYWPVDCWGLW